LTAIGIIIIIIGECQIERGRRRDSGERCCIQIWQIGQLKLSLFESREHTIVRVEIAYDKHDVARILVTQLMQAQVTGRRVQIKMTRTLKLLLLLLLLIRLSTCCRQVFAQVEYGLVHFLATHCVCGEANEAVQQLIVQLAAVFWVNERERFVTSNILETLSIEFDEVVELVAIWTWHGKRRWHVLVLIDLVVAIDYAQVIEHDDTHFCFVFFYR
jgi:hypothetical protein